jgi:hypothetical protein
MRQAGEILARAANLRRVVLSALAFAACLGLVIPVLAQTSAHYDLSWHVTTGSSGRMESAGHTAMGTVGQPLVGTMTTGGGHALCSGFWCGVLPEYRVYLPLVLRGG